MSPATGIILAIEAAIGGGSLSLLRDDQEIANWVGSSNISKAEDLLSNIDRLLRENGVDRSELGLIAVSAGPGSFTGIRIGIATGLGLKTGLSIPMASQSALTAMIHTSPAHGPAAAVVPTGRSAVCMQSFTHSGPGSIAIDSPRTMTEADLVDVMCDETGITYILHKTLYGNVPGGPNIVDFGSNIARSIGLVCRDNVELVTQPLFVSKSF